VCVCVCVCVCVREREREREKGFLVMRLEAQPGEVRLEGST